MNTKSLNMIKDISDKLWLVTDIIRVESLSNHNVIDAVNDDIVIEPLLGEEVFSTNGILKKIENDQVIPHRNCTHK